MRAKRVNENIEFKRGESPRDTLKIGSGRNPFLHKLRWGKEEDVQELEDIIRNAIRERNKKSIVLDPINLSVEHQRDGGMKIEYVDEGEMELSIDSGYDAPDGWDEEEEDGWEEETDIADTETLVTIVNTGEMDSYHITCEVKIRGDVRRDSWKSLDKDIKINGPSDVAFWLKEAITEANQTLYYYS